MLYDWLKISAKTRGNSKALVYRDNYLSWRGLLHRVDRRSQEFKSMGLKPGAWVGLMLGNVPDFVILALALSRLDVTVVPIDPTTGSRELELMLAAAPLRALVTRPRGSEATGGPLGTRMGENGEEEEVPEIRRRLQGTLLTCSVFKNENPDFGVQPLSVMFTADSLGDPKGVLRTQKNLEAITEQIIESLSIDTSSKILTSVPLFHAYGWDIGLLPTLKTGATMFLEEEISAKRVAKLLRDHTIDILPGTPTMYGELARLPTAKTLKVETPRFLSAGAPLPTEVATSIRKSYGVQILSCYHSTETGAIAIDLDGKHPATVGKPLESVEVRVTPLEGARKGTKRGAIWVRSPSLSPCSIGPYEDSNDYGGDGTGIGQIDDDDWYRTGDIGKFDRNSRLVLESREDDLVKVEGKRVALGEVEGCLEAFPNVREAQARLESAPYTAPMVVARVVATGKVQAEEIIDHCARNLAPYKVPRRIEFCDALEG